MNGDHLSPTLRKLYDFGMSPTKSKIGHGLEYMQSTNAVMGHDGRMTVIGPDIKWAVLFALEDHPQGNTEITHTLGYHILTVRPIVTRLQDEGLVYYTGEHAPTDQGATERVNTTTTLGHEVAKRGVARVGSTD